ncbi:MAG: iron-molybdenum cofactor biosynthesis protein [Ignavibacteriae bacterium]|nr:MAG: iron-molybdenum cofactor biosynthesis protein [Ignavibacteriota bacterium]
MKIAIPTDNQVTISRHFGRTKGFVIYEIEDDKIVNKVYNENNFTGHAKGMHHQEGHSHNQHSHAGILNAIGDCQAVIAGGMGQRLYNDFEQNNIKVFVTQENEIEKVIELYLKNELDNNSDSCCKH